MNETRKEEQHQELSRRKPVLLIFLRHSGCPFCKQAVADVAAAREKIGYVFRDLLGDKYKSSSKSKVAKRHEERVGRASMKLERALRRSYPDILIDSTSGPVPVEARKGSEPEHLVSAAVVSTLNATAARTAMPPSVSRFDLFVTDELPSAAEVTMNFDFNEEELMNSPLIDPED